MNSFIPSEKLAAVKVCQTTGRQLLEDLGPPAGQGRDGDMGTLQWSAAAVVTDSHQTAVGTQSVFAWIDGDGLVAGFVVNPSNIPQKPVPCREQNPRSAPEQVPKRDAKPSTAFVAPSGKG